MATAPVINSATFDKDTYAPGDTITATVAYTAGTSGGAPESFGATFVATDTNTGLAGQMTVSFVVDGPATNDPTDVEGSDTGGRAWDKISDDGSTAVFTATA